MAMAMASINQSIDYLEQVKAAIETLTDALLTRYLPTNCIPNDCTALLLYDTLTKLEKIHEESTTPKKSMIHTHTV